MRFIIASAIGSIAPLWKRALSLIARRQKTAERAGNDFVSRRTGELLDRPEGIMKKERETIHDVERGEGKG